MSTSSFITVHINGTQREIPVGSTISAVLELLKLNPRFLAVERNRELVPRGQHANCQLETDDQLEIVTLVGGG